MADMNVNAGNPIRSLTTDFGDKPLGRLDKRHVQVLAPHAPRIGVNAPASNPVARFFARLLDALTPSHVRSDSKFRHGLEDTSKTVGTMLGAIADGNTPALQKLLAQVGRDALPVTSRGASLGDVLVARVGVHMNKLDHKQIAALVLGLGKIVLDDPAFLSMADKIRTTAQTVILADALTTTTETLAALVDRPKGRPERMTASSGLLEGAPKILASNLKSSGLWDGPTMDQAPLKLLKAALGQMDKGARATVLEQLPLAELMALRDAPDSFVADDARLGLALDIAEAVETETASRRIALYGNLQNLVKTAPGLGSDPKGLAQLLGQIDREWADMKSLGIKDEEIEEILGDVGGLLGEMTFDPEPFKDMTDKELSSLHHLMQTYAITPDLDTLNSEITLRDRIADALRPVATDLKLALDYLAVERLTGFASTVQNMLASLENAYSDFRDLRELEANDETYAIFLQMVTDAAFGGGDMILEKLQVIDKLFRTDPCASVIGWLGVVAESDPVGEKPLGHEANLGFRALDGLRRNVAARLENMGDLAPRNFDFDPKGKEVVSGSDVADVLGRFGIKIKDGEPVPPQSFVRIENDQGKCEALRIEINEVLSGAGGKMHEKFKMASMFAADVTRNGKNYGSYLMDFGSGPEEMVPPDHKRRGADDILQIVEQRLFALFDNDEKMVGSVTKFMHQGNFANLLESVMRPDLTPIRDDKGAPVSFMGSRHDLKMVSVARNSDGSAELRLLFDMSPLFELRDTEGMMDQKECDLSTNFTWDITARVLPDGETFAVPKFSQRYSVF